MTSESDLQIQVADYLRLQYPDVMFHSDFGSGKMVDAGRVRMFIAHSNIIIPRCYEDANKYNGCHWVCFGHEKGEYKKPALVVMNGLFLELKKDGTRLKEKNGDWANEHVAEQAQVLEKLRERGYCAEFAVGLEEAKRIIDEYLGGK